MKKMYNVYVTVGKARRYFDRHNVMEDYLEEYKEFIKGLYNGKAELNFEIVYTEIFIDNDTNVTRRVWENGCFRTVCGKTKTIR